jgi:hypothetical protein
MLNHNKFEKMVLVRLDHLCIALPPVALCRPAAQKIKRSTQQVTMHKSDNAHNTQFTHHTHQMQGTCETQHGRKDLDTLEMAAAAKEGVQLLQLRVLEEAELLVVPPQIRVLPYPSCAKDFGSCSTKFIKTFKIEQGECRGARP